jgi:hypothetical protein
MSEEFRGGVSGYYGMRYQIIASMWITLWLMLDARCATEVIVEPDCQDDLEAKLREVVPPGGKAAPLSENQRSSTITAFDGKDRRFVFQMKQRSCAIWTPATLREVLGHGTANPSENSGGRNRTSAFKLLIDDPSMTYILVTNAPVNAHLGPLASSTLPLPLPSLSAQLPPSAVPDGFAGQDDVVRGRVHILKGLEDEILVNRIRDLLLAKGDIPITEIEACHAAIEKAFWQCMHPGQSRRFTDDKLRSILLQYGARRAVGPGPGYVAPTTAKAAAEVLRARRCVVLVGSPLTGKASLAEYIADGFTLPALPLNVEYLQSFSDLPERLRMIGPTLVVVKNGWGHGSVESTHEVFDLATALARASQDKYVIATCDADMYVQLPPEMRTRLERYIVRISKDDYSQDIRWQIVLNQARLDGWQLAALMRSRETVLRELSEPSSLSLYGYLVQTEASRLQESENDELLDLPAPNAADWVEYDWADNIGSSKDRNRELFDEFVQRVINETVGFRTKRVLQRYGNDPELHAALLFCIDLTLPEHDVLSMRTGSSTVMQSHSVTRVERQTGRHLDMHNFVAYLLQNDVLKMDDRFVWMPNATRDILRELTQQSIATRIAIMAVASELAQPLAPASNTEQLGIFANRISRIALLIHTTCTEGPIPSGDWNAITETVEKALTPALLSSTPREFGCIVEAAMDWDWGRSALPVIVHALHPEHLPPLIEPSYFFDHKDRHSYFWLSTFRNADQDCLCRFMHRFLLEFMPYTPLDYRHVAGQFASFLNASGVVKEVDVRTALRTLEQYGSTDFGDGDDSDRMRNKPALLALLSTLSSIPYQSILPRALYKWEL